MYIEHNYFYHVQYELVEFKWRRACYLLLKIAFKNSFKR